MKGPDFFIVGAPKCGTTSLYSYLREHPDIFMPHKEVYFFGSDLTYKGERPSFDFYRSLFRPAGEGQSTGEASVWYLLSERSAEEIREVNPEARIIIMLRDPVEMLHSLHFEQLTNGNEDIERFEEALDADEARKRGERIPELIGSPLEALQYRRVGSYKEQVERYLRVFGEEQVHIILFEDFVQDPKAVYEGVLDHLGLERKADPSFERLNAPGVYRFKALRDLLKKRPGWAIRMARLLLPYRPWRQRFLEKLDAINQRPAERPSMEESTRKRLREELRFDVRALGELLGKDLESFWWGEKES